MSKIPKPVQVPRPASKVSSNAAQSAGHEELLRLMCLNTGFLVPARLQTLGEDVWLKIVPAQKKHATLTADSLAALRRKASDVSIAAEERERWASYISPCEQYAKRSAPAFDELRLSGSVWNVTIEAQIFEYKGSRGERREQVGFVDLTCELRLPSDITLDSGLPYEVTELAQDGWSMSAHMKNEMEICREPVWNVKYDEFSVWIDIRPALPPIGQLLRELKTLRQYANDNTVIWVLTQAVDEECEKILAHEGFFISGRAWLDEHIEMLNRAEATDT